MTRIVALAGLMLALPVAGFAQDVGACSLAVISHTETGEVNLPEGVSISQLPPYKER